MSLGKIHFEWGRWPRRAADALDFGQVNRASDLVYGVIRPTLCIEPISHHFEDIRYRLLRAGLHLYHSNKGSISHRPDLLK